MGELIELIIRLIEALSGGDKKKNAPSPADWQAQQAEWERQRREWEAAQQRQQQVQPVIATPAVSQKGKKRGKQSGGRSPTPPPVPVRTLVADLAQPAQRVEAPRKAAARTAASAKSIAQWARPGTLRSQFILTEVLKPPMSVREARYR